MRTLYIAHNFNLRRVIRKWELRMESKYNIRFDNPFYDNEGREEQIQAIDSFKDGSPEQKAYLLDYYNKANKTIVSDDLTKIRKSDGILAFANDTRIGTPMEIFFAASVIKIPVYVITHKYQNHPWIQKFATKVFTSRKAFEEFIKKEFGLRHGL